MRAVFSPGYHAAKCGTFRRERAQVAPSADAIARLIGRVLIPSVRRSDSNAVRTAGICFGIR